MTVNKREFARVFRGNFQNRSDADAGAGCAAAEVNIVVNGIDPFHVPHNAGDLNMSPISFEPDVAR